MPLRFHKSIKLGKLLKLNINKNSISFSAGVKGAHVTMNNKGRKTASVGIPGTGLSYQHTLESETDYKKNKKNKNSKNKKEEKTNGLLSEISSQLSEAVNDIKNDIIGNAKEASENDGGNEDESDEKNI